MEIRRRVVIDINAASSAEVEGVEIDAQLPVLPNAEGFLQPHIQHSVGSVSSRPVRFGSDPDVGVLSRNALRKVDTLNRSSPGCSGAVLEIPGEDNVVGEDDRSHDFDLERTVKSNTAVRISHIIGGVEYFVFAFCCGVSRVTIAFESRIQDRALQLPPVGHPLFESQHTSRVLPLCFRRVYAMPTWRFGVISQAIDSHVLVI